MPRFIADEEFKRDIVRGILSRDSTVAIVSVQDMGLNCQLTSDRRHYILQR